MTDTLVGQLTGVSGRWVASPWMEADSVQRRQPSVPTISRALAAERNFDEADYPIAGKGPPGRVDTCPRR